jgi:hypothetical protein
LNVGRLTRKRLEEALSYSSDTGLFIWASKLNRRVVVGSAAGSIDHQGYLRIVIDGSSYRAHRLAWFWTNGAWPAMQIDHIDGNKLNNSIANLRDVSAGVNAQNKRIARRGKKYSPLLGVTRDKKGKGSWFAQIVIDSRPQRIGTFATEGEAHEAYLAAKRSLHVGCTI